MASAGTVTVDFAAETAKFTAELKKVNGSLKGLQGGFSSINSLAKNFLPIASAGALVSFAKNAFNAANELDRLSQKTQISVESLSRLQFAAEQADTEFSSLTTAITQFQKRLGSGDAAVALDRIGISVANLKTLAPEDQLVEIARGFESVSDPAKRVALAMELFGKAGADLLPFLGQGAAGIQRLKDEADRLGVTIDQKTVQALDRAEKQAQRLVAAAKGVVTQLLAIASIVIFDDEKNEQAEALIAAMQREKELREQIFKLENPSLLLRILANEESRTKQLAEANKFLQRNLEIIDQIGRKERERLDIEKQSQALSAGSDIGEVSVTGRRVRVPGSPENFDELQQDFEEKQNEEINAALLQGEIDLRNDLTKVLAESVDRDMALLDQKFADEQALIDFRHRFELEQEQLKEDNLLRIRQEGFQAAQALMTAFGGKYKKYAQALLVVQKAQAVAQIIVDTSAAAANALKTYGPTPVGYAAAAGAIAFGAARIATVAATFIGGGSAPQAGGSAAAPVFTSNADTAASDTRATAQSQRVTQIIIPGNIYSVDDFKQVMVDTLKEVSDSDVIIFDQNSAQAQVIRQA